MFKLESYITPLLLNYVDKYIKNLKPEDSQFSLWGGDAVFCNLDLRLDVLEQELQLPFTFVNGHIHELRIHIPWTKLGSEPVIITINTIECILKLCTDSDVPDCDTKTFLLSKKISSNKLTKRSEVIEAPPGYVQSLINRVISNISIVCNNVILKYVEDDIVLSLNIKSVELFSVNDKWEKAFADLSPAVRKVIHMQDLTVCLDKRDASGKIETYQDPLLYRCSSTWRLYSIYNSPHSKYPAVTRIHMFCESLDFSLTNQQIPMFLRLLNLCIALQNQSTFKDKEGTNVMDDKTDCTSTNLDEQTDDKESKAQEESWGNWAWSFVPDMTPMWNAYEVEEQEKEANLLKATKIFHFGIYIGKTSCILKQTLVVPDPTCCGSSKLFFSPLLVLDLYGCCMEFTSKGKDFVNMQIGISGSTVTGLEECACGYEDFSSNESVMPRVFLKSGVPPSSGHAYNFLSSSLFDPLAVENCNQRRNYCFNKEEHLSKLTEEVLVERFPAFAFDYLYELDVPEEWLDKMSTVTTLFLEESNWHESSTCRLVFGPLCVDVTSSLVHRISKLIFSAKDCDYSYYSESSKPSSQAMNIDDDVIEQLEESVPVRMYHLTLFKPVIRLYVADHTSSFTASKQESKRKKKKNMKSSKHFCSPKASEANVCVELYADCVDLQSSTPMYPLRLVKIIDKLPDTSQFLLHHCYNSSSIKVFDLEISLQKEGVLLLPERNILRKTSLTFFMKTLMLPDVWTNLKNVTLCEYAFECDKIGISLHEAQFFILLSIFHSWTSKHFNSVAVEKIRSMMQILKVGYPLLFAQICDIRSLYMKTDELYCFKLTVHSTCLEFQNKDHVTVLFSAPEATSIVHKGQDFLKVDDSQLTSRDDKKQYFLQFLFQVPKQEVPALLILHISGSTICFDPDFFTWLSSVHKIMPTVFDSEQELNSPCSIDVKENSTCSSRTKEQSVSQSLTKSQSTLLNFASKEGFLKGLQIALLEYSDFLSQLVLEIDIESLCGLLPPSCTLIKQSSNSATLLVWQSAIKSGGLNDCFIFSFPRIKIKNNNSSSCFFQAEDILQMNVPVEYSPDCKKYQDCFPWTLQLDCMSIYSVSEKFDKDHIQFLFSPTTASVTVALSNKSNQNQLGLCIHMDSKSVNVVLSPLQMQILVNCLKIILPVKNFIEVIKSWNSYFCSKASELSESESIHPEEKIHEVSKAKNIFDETNEVNKNPPDEDTSNAECKLVKKLTVWSQLTLSKLSVVLMGKLPDSDEKDFKVQLDIEEIISSLDIQKVYSKFITKLTSLGAHCFIRKNNESQWQPGPYDGVILFCNNMVPKHLKQMPNTSNLIQHAHTKPDNQPFLVATYTRALCSNAKQKWNLKQNSSSDDSKLEYISEIDLKVKSFDVVLWMSVFDVVCKTFYILFRTFHESYLKDINEAHLPAGAQFCSKNLPLLYIETNIVRMYLPENSLLNSFENISDEKENSTTAKKEILLLQLDYITLTSQIENPLSRIILNSELYYSAINGKTEGLSGSAVEDRQYQLDISGLVLGSVLGINILHKEEFKKDLSSYHPITMGENPALEWNIGVVREKRNSSPTTYIITYIVSPINVRVAIAPAIICDNPNKSFLNEKIIVAGISFELSITKDICFYLSDHQICFIYSLFKNNLHFITELFSNLRNTELSKKDFLAFSNIASNPTNDAGVSHIYMPPKIFRESNEQCKLAMNEKCSKPNFVPFEALVTASSISFTFFYHDEDVDEQVHGDIKEKSTYLSECDSSMVEKSKNLNEHSPCDSKNEDTSSSSKTESESQTSRLHPYLYISVTQPHSYILCYPEQQKFESSCFDLLVNGSSSSHVVQKPYTSSVLTPSDFRLCYLETRPGEPHVKTGIRPAFFTIKITDFLCTPGNAVLSIERPVRCNLRTELLNSTAVFAKHFRSEWSSINTSHRNMELLKTNENLESESTRFSILSYFQNISLCTNQVVLEVSPALDNNDSKILLSIGSFKVQTEVESCTNNWKSLNLEVNASSLVFQLHSDSQTWNFLHPLNFSMQSKYSLDTWFHLQLCIVAESMLLNLSIHHLLKLKAAVEAIQDQYQKELEVFNSVMFNDEREIEYHNVVNEIRKRKIWNDDLRKGMFQFIQACDDQDIEPKPNEIVFCPASKNHRASMTWCYPEPRALTKVEVSPVPFQCENGNSNSEFQIITCYLQYWNSTSQEYINLCDFMLSETNAFVLDLPNLTSDSLGVSDRWRVLLDRPTYIDDDGAFDKGNPSLSPLALAACMCIDSCFDPCITPVVQVKMTSEQIKIIAYNYFEKSDTSLFLHGFKFHNQSPSSQEFAALSFITPVISFIKWSTKLKGEFSSGLTCEVLEYRNLTMLPIISPVDVQCNATINFFQEKVPAVDIELTFQPCFVHLTQSIVHTLMYTMSNFSKHFSWLSSFQDNYYDSVLPNYYFICNNLTQSVTIGQAGTEEYIHLAPFEVHAYSWWCHKIQQKLRISMEKILPKWSKEFNIDSEGIKEIILGSDVIFVKVKTLSNLQKQVILDGQLVIHNQLHFPLQVKINMSGSESCYIEPVSSMKTSAAYLISSEKYESLSLSITAAPNSGLWSSEVHARDNVLIKIPWDSDPHYCNAWCQVAYQELTEHSFCITVFISPLFVLRSNLPISLKVDVTSKEEDMYTLDLIGRGYEVNLFESSEWDHKLKLNFHSMPDVAVSVSSLTVSVCDLSPIPLQSFTGDENLHEVCHSLNSQQHKLWPYSFLERIPFGKSSSDSIHFESENQSSLAPAIASQNVCFRLKVERVQRWIGLNSLLIDIKPYVMLVNRLNIDLYLFENGEIQWMLPPNSVAMPTSSSDGFQLSVLEDGKHFFSQFLKVDDSSTSSNVSSTVDLSSLQYIPNSGRISVVIKIGNKRACLLKIKSEVHEGITVITVFPEISFLTKASRNLQLYLLCSFNVDKKVDFSLSEFKTSVYCNSDCFYPLLFWDVTESISSSFSSNVEFHLFIFISFTDSLNWSSPLYLHSKMKKNSRHFTAVHFKSGSSSFSSEPFVVTSHKYEDILYLVIRNDPCPLLLLHNQTDMNVFYGQSHLTSEGNVIFEETQPPYIVPLLETNSSSYYMFPAIQETFPNVPDKVPQLCLGIMSKDNKYLWSAPFGVDTDKQFVHILGVCDFMIQSKQIGHTVHLFIDSVNRVELTAKEIRTRIAQATKTNTQNSLVDESSSEADICDQSKNVLKYMNKTKSSKVMQRKQFMTPKLPFHVYINARIIHISLKICDELKEFNKSIEVVRLNVDNVLLFSRPNSENSLSNAQDISLCLEHIQFDNQIDLENNVVYDFPVILQKYIATNTNSSVRTEGSDMFLPNKVRENSMFIMNVAIQLGSEEHNNFIFNSLSIKVLPLSLYLEDTFYYRIGSLWRSYMTTRCLEYYSPSNCGEFPRELTFISESFVNPIHFQSMKIEISEVSLSLHASLKIYLSLEQSMLRFKPFEKKNLFSTPYEVGRMLVLHYLTGALFRAGWVVGSLDILGNPAGFARAVGAGMSDFIYLPYKGLFQGPRAFVSGLSNGALSLFTQISSGALICLASLASSISRNMDFMCLDDEHLARQELMRCHLPHGVSEGLLQGLSGFGLSLLSAIAGIVDHPLKVLISPSTPMRTASGIVGGFGKGIIGMLTKPIGGAAELLSQPVYGLLHGAGWLNCPKRQYQPVNISFEMCISSSLKYSRKVAQCCIYEGVIALMEATYANVNGEYEKKILLLNSEALCVLDEDEITLQSTFPVSEINCHIMKSDRSTLIVLPDKDYKKQVYLESSDAVDRIVEYVKKNCLENTNVDENIFTSEDCMLDCLTKSTSSYHMFFLYPRERNLFFTLFLYAKNKAMKKGFYTC